MLIGIPKEVKNNESRVGITPLGVELLVQNGLDVMVEKNAGTAAGFEDSAYIEAGAKMEPSAEKV
ncbi:Alanine dehydrogenase 2 [Jeotgalibaca dankookensis]|uniref:Alanine dehydrogenase 2 n=1 Tax=Jeotgalibaca dankookensis TaxID=708126 RepID=A0A1S6IMJ8_9LACT|nr:Alanine dehydrogenase 2 [Jeotgalibaca dankookensis]